MIFADTANKHSDLVEIDLNCLQKESGKHTGIIMLKVINHYILFFSIFKHGNRNTRKE